MRPIKFRGFSPKQNEWVYGDLLCELNYDKLEAGKLKKSDLDNFMHALSFSIPRYKHHTIRRGVKCQFKACDEFQPVVWSGQPYASPQIRFAPPIKVKQVIPFDIEGEDTYIGKPLKSVSPELLDTIARNDGLGIEDFKSWFKYPAEFNGNIIVWGEVKY